MNALNGRSDSEPKCPFDGPPSHAPELRQHHFHEVSTTEVQRWTWENTDQVWRYAGTFDPAVARTRAAEIVVEPTEAEIEHARQLARDMGWPDA